MVTLTSNPVEQIIDIYLSPEFYWVTDRMPRANVRSYIWQLIERGNLFWTVDGDRVVGICETWRINFQVLGKLVCRINEPIEQMNTTGGNIAYVANVWIDKDCRMGKVFKSMRNEWYRRYHDCEYYVGHARRKTDGLFKSFKVSELRSSLFKTGE